MNEQQIEFVLTARADKLDRLELKLKRIAVLVGRIEIGDVTTHVATNEAWFAANIACDDWAELEELTKTKETT